MEREAEEMESGVSKQTTSSFRAVRSAAQGGVGRVGVEDYVAQLKSQEK